MVDENLLAGYLQHLSFTHVDIPEGAPRHEYDAILKKQEALIKENPFYAFTYGRHVDIPLEIIDRWIGVFRELGTTKEGTRRDYHEAMKAGA